MAISLRSPFISSTENSRLPAMSGRFGQTLSGAYSPLADAAAWRWNATQKNTTNFIAAPFRAGKEFTNRANVCSLRLG
jgi:uncharacterized lipoprotein NlpE involved in copper resistance